jgi:hypothetical protein
MDREYSCFLDVVMWTFDACCSHLGGFILVQHRVWWKAYELTTGVVEDGELIKNL